MSAPSSDKAGVRQVIRTMKKIGALPTEIENGEDTIKVIGLGEREVLSRMFQTDEETLRFESPNNHLTVYFVYGNDPDEVVCDWWPANDNPLDIALDKLIDDWIDAWVERITP